MISSRERTRSPMRVGRPALWLVVFDGFEGVRDVRMGRYIELELPDGADAEREVRAMCEQLLANPVIETYEFEIAISDQQSVIR